MPVAVEIEGGHAHAAAVRDPDARLLAHVLEGAVAPVPVEDVELRLVGERGRIAVRAVVQLVVRVVRQVVHDEQVEEPVPVVVEERRRDRRPIPVQPGLLRDVLERPVSSVPVEDALPHVDHEEVRAAVVVEVGRHGHHAEAGPRDARLLRDVLERPVARVPG